MYLHFIAGFDTFYREERMHNVKILVCVKQVPDSSDTLGIDDRTGWFFHKPLTVFRMNRYDEFAVEEALQIRERLPGTAVHALSVGPDRVTTTIRRALEMGADHGVHVLVKRDEYMSPFAVASAIASYAGSRSYDLIMTGVMAEDDMACVTGQLTAAVLDLPCASSVIRTELHRGKTEITVDSEIENGCRASYLLGLPAVITIQSGINNPRYPSLSNVMRARSQQQESVRIEDLGMPSAREICSGIRMPDTSSQGLLIEGAARDKAKKLMSILHERSLLS